jgi:adenosylcobinamide kinase / adenosylcobinamide-phosphate guanylyltransferase
MLPYHARMALTLILGGARSGKSDFALQLAAASGRPVVFVATMEAGDDDVRARIARHRAERPQHWRTVEEPIALLDALAKYAEPGAFVIIDCLTLWVSNLLLAALPSPDDASAGDAAAGDMAPDEAAAAIRAIVAQVEALASWCAACDGEVAIVSNEVGSGVVPAYALGRAFRDALGSANRIVAARADAVYSVVAGLAVDMKALGAIPVAPRGVSER